MPFAFNLMKVFKPNVFVELGTHYGDSYFTFCQARETYNLDTKCFAIDHWKGDVHSALYGDEVFDRVYEHNKKFYSEFSELIRNDFSSAIDNFKDDSIDLLHIDGFHTFEAVENDFRSWLPKVKENGLVLLHDICVQERDFGVWKFWEQISREFSSCALSFGNGLGILQKNTDADSLPIVENSDLYFKEFAKDVYLLSGEKLLLETQNKKYLKEITKEKNNSFYIQKNSTINLNNCKQHNEDLNYKLNQANERIFALQKELKCVINNKNIFRFIIGKLCHTKENIRCSWVNPKNLFSLSKKPVSINGCISLTGENLVKAIFINIGKRNVLCDYEININEKNKDYFFHTYLKMGYGFKKCTLIAVLSNDKKIRLGSRIFFSLKSSSNYYSGENYLTSFRRLDPFESWLRVNQLTSRNLKSYRHLNDSCEKNVLFSIIIPVYKPQIKFLKEALQSVYNQTFNSWQICITDDCSNDDELSTFLNQRSKDNPKIKLHQRIENGGIAKATNDSISLATGEFLVFLDQDDLLSPIALAEFACYLQRFPSTDLIYSDDDKIDVDGRHYSPQFKPDWSPELLLSYCYISHAKVVRSSLSKQIGHFREGYDGSQDYDYLLRLTEKCRKIGHISKILYHWRALPSSTAFDAGSKPYSFAAGKKAVADAFERRNVICTVEQPVWAQDERLGIFLPVFPHQGPDVTILIPTRNNLKFLKNCLESLKKTAYRNYTITILDNDSDDESTLDYLENLSHTKLRLSNKGGKFNFSYLVNEGVKNSNTSHVLLLNDDTEIINPNWLSQMVGLISLEGVGCVGAKLLFANNTIQHAGIVHEISNGFAGPAFRGEPTDSPGYLNYIRVNRNYSAVTAACLLIKRKTFLELDGFDEDEFAVAYNDVDFCYRLIESGLRCVYCSDALLYHHEGSSRGFNDNISELISFKQKYRDFYDSYYNTNLSTNNEKFEIYPRRIKSDFVQVKKLLAVTHNLNFEGAPISMFEMICEIARISNFKITVVSLQDGPLLTEYENKGIEVKVINFPSRHISKYDFDNFLVSWAEKSKLEQYDLLYANTLDSYFAIKIASEKGIPSVWNIRESISADKVFQSLDPVIAQKAYSCFSLPYKIVFVAYSTENIYRCLDTTSNFKVIKNSISPQRFHSNSLIENDNELTVSKDENVILCVGTICERKGQKDLIEAFMKLPQNLQENTTIVFAGNGDTNYCKRIRKIVNNHLLLRKKIVFLESSAHVKSLYKKSDIYVCTSKEESYPRVILEAMHFNLPIITTPVYGISEQVIEDKNALFFNPGDFITLSDKISLLLTDIELRKSLSKGSSEVLKFHDSFEDMAKKYHETFLEAVETG